MLHIRKKDRRQVVFLLHVELEGVEPSSKQRNHMLSTGLSSLGLSGTGLDEATGPEPYLLKSHP